MSYKQQNSKGNTYYLNKKEVTRPNGQKFMLYFFSKDERNTACDLPDTHVVVESPRNGFLTLKKKQTN